MIPTLNYISSKKSQPTQETINEYKQLMEYVATYPNYYIHFHANSTTLMMDKYAAYLVMPKARSCIAGYYYLGNKPNLNLNLN